MNYLFILLIRLYQITISPIVATFAGSTAGCRFYPSCSDYAVKTLKEDGFFVGLKKSVIRLLKCQPFYS